jgi:O-antigen ligase
MLEFGAYLIALFLPLAFNPSATQPFGDIKVTFVRIVVAGMSIVAVLSGFYYRDPQHSLLNHTKSILAELGKLKKDNPLFTPVLIYGGVYIIATFTSINPLLSLLGGSTRLGTINVLSLVLFFLLVASVIRSLSQMDRLVSSLIIGSIPVAIYGWVQYLGLDPLDWTTGSLSPVHSTTGYSLYLGAYLGMVIPFTISRMVTGLSGVLRKFIPYLIVLVLQVTCLLFTLSRGAWLGLLGGCLLFLWLLAYRWKKTSLIVLSIVLLLVGSYLFVVMNRGWVGLPPVNRAGLSDMPVQLARKISNNDRMLTWKYTIPMISGHYLLGYGPETYFCAFWYHYTPESYTDPPVLYIWDPHNILLYHLTATGVLGLITFLWILYRFYRISLNTIFQGEDRRSVITTAATLSSVTAFLIQAQFNPNTILPFAIFWLVLALGICMYRKEDLLIV